MKLSKIMKIPSDSWLTCLCLVLCVKAQSDSLGNSTANSTTTIQLPPSTRTIQVLEIQPTETAFSSTLPAEEECNLYAGTSCKFSYLIPEKNTQGCNIYGPLCQTGSITVGVDLTTATTTATLPCSLYLTAQSKFLNLINPLPCQIKPYFPEVWTQGFGHSPECARYADLWNREGQYTFSNCGGNNTIATFSQGVCAPSQIPPGVRNQQRLFYWDCCGNCTVDIAEVRLYYFPDETADTSCDANKTIRHNTTSIADHNQKRGQSLLAGKTAMLGTYTFTSPSVYLEIVGTAAVRDVCGQVGSILTNPIVELAPGVLSTYSNPIPHTIGEEYYDPLGFYVGGPGVGDQKPLNIADLACPTFGVGRSTGADGSVKTTFGPPYLPIIIPPLQLMTLDPAWQKTCFSIISYAPFIKSFGIIDPPRILTPVAALGPSLPAAVPAVQTPTPEPDQQPVALSAQTTLASIPEATIASSGPDPPSDPPANPPSNPPSDLKAPLDHGTSNPLMKPPTASQVNSADLRQSPNSGPVQSPPSSQGTDHGNDPNGSQSNLGGIILSALGWGGTPPSTDNIPVQIGNGGFRNEDITPPSTSPSAEILTVASQTFTANPSKIVIAGNTFFPGSAGIALSVSLAPSGTLFINTNPVPIANPSPLPLNPVLTVAGQTFKANPTGFNVAGSEVIPGGTPVTLSGTPVSLAPSGIVVIGDSTINLRVQTPAPNVFTIADQTFTANPTGFNVAGSEVVPGAPAITIFGTPVSLAPSGVVVIGGSTSRLQAQPPTPAVFTVAGQTFTASPNGFTFAGSNVVPGGTSILVSGTTISLSPSGILIVGDSSIALPTQTAGPGVFTVGRLILTAESSAILADGTKIVPGGPAVTISGTPVSLNLAGNSGVLIVGTSSYNFPDPTSSSDVFAFGGLIFTATSSSVVIDGITLIPGGSDAVISGTHVSLNPGLSLIVGSSVIPLDTSSATAQAFLGGQRRQLEMSGLSRILLIMIGVVVLGR